MSSSFLSLSLIGVSLLFCVSVFPPGAANRWKKEMLKVDVSEQVVMGPALLTKRKPSAKRQFLVVVEITTTTSKKIAKRD